MSSYGLTLHYTAKRIKNSLGGKVFGGNQVDEMFLAIFLLDKRSDSDPGF